MFFRSWSFCTSTYSQQDVRIIYYGGEKMKLDQLRFTKETQESRTQDSISYKQVYKSINKRV